MGQIKYSVRGLRCPCSGVDIGTLSAILIPIPDVSQAQSDKDNRATAQYTRRYLAVNLVDAHTNSLVEPQEVGTESLVKRLSLLAQTQSVYPALAFVAVSCHSCKSI